MSTRCEQLAELNNLKAVCDSEHIRNAPVLQQKLAERSLIQSAQAERIDNHNKQVSDLVSTYNQLIASLSTQFAYWDELLTQEELKRAPKRMSDVPKPQ